LVFAFPKELLKSIFFVCALNFNAKNYRGLSVCRFSTTKILSRQSSTYLSCFI
jgi:hypothetical protein